jgi:hypothetical protein
LNIEQGIRSSGAAVVANIIARDALNSLVGDQCYVIDDGNGEWATFTYDGSVWTKVGGQRSVATDARTLVLDVNLSTTTGTQSLGYISAGRTVIGVRVLVTTLGPIDAEVSVGIVSDTSEFFESRDAILSQIGQYATNPDYRTTAYTEVVAEITNPTPGAGQFTVILTYV